MTITSEDSGAAQWHVLGAGAMGCLWAVRLWQHSPLQRQVSLLLRSPAELAKYQAAGGITLEESWRHSVDAKIAVPAAAVTEAGSPLSHLLVATKAQDVTSALESVRHRLGTDTRIVLVQNGVQVQRAVTRAFGQERVFCLSTSHGAWRRAPFHVVHAGRGTAWLGTLGTASEASLQALLALLPAQAMQIRHDADIAVRLWQKFAVNCAVNPLTVLYNCRNGDLLVRPDARLALDALVTEIAALLQALPEVPALPPLPPSVTEVLQATADNLSSTLQDARNGRPTELGHLNGYLSTLAREHGLPSPLNDALMQRIASRAAPPAA